MRIRDPTRRSLIEFRGPVFPIDVTGQDVGIPFSFFNSAIPFFCLILKISNVVKHLHQVMLNGKCLAMSDRQVLDPIFRFSLFLLAKILDQKFNQSPPSRSSIRLR